LFGGIFIWVEAVDARECWGFWVKRGIGGES
jgi:hypothetical protein